jgi:hypothetical protein
MRQRRMPLYHVDLSPCIRGVYEASEVRAGGKGEVDDNRRSTLGVWHLVMVHRVGECTCGPGGYERVEMRRGEVRKRTDVPLQLLRDAS